jgi:adenylate cyclase
VATEIERKFLPAGDDWRPFATARMLLRQGYLANNERCSVRVRVAGGDVGWLSVKAMTPGPARAEYEYPVPLAEANAMLDALCARPFIEKWRHLVPWRGHDWEIDEFLGDNAGLIVAEVELTRLGEVPEMPPWIGREVTDDVRFYNFSLAERPWASFREAFLHEAGSAGAAGQGAIAAGAPQRSGQVKETP